MSTLKCEILIVTQRNFSITWSQLRHSSVITSNKGTAFRSSRLNISLTIDSKFHMPSGSRPLRGLRRLLHSADAGGAALLK